MNDVNIYSKVEEAVATMVNKFKERFKEFTSENDLHCYIYHILYKIGINEVNKRLILHKEYPSCSNRGRKKTRKGHFDLIVFNPESLSKKNGIPEVLIAMEFKLIRNNSKKYIESIRQDFEQISDEINKKNIKKGYVLVFSQIPYKHTNEIQIMIKKYRSASLRTCYIEEKFEKTELNK